MSELEKVIKKYKYAEDVIEKFTRMLKLKAILKTKGLSEEKFSELTTLENYFNYL